MNKCDKGHVDSICIKLDRAQEQQYSAVKCYICETKYKDGRFSVPKNKELEIKSCNHKKRSRIYCMGKTRFCSCYGCGIVFYWDVPSGFICNAHVSQYPQERYTNEIYDRYKDKILPIGSIEGDVYIQRHKGPNLIEDENFDYYIRCIDCGVHKILSSKYRKQQSKIIRELYPLQMLQIDKCKHSFYKISSVENTIQSSIDGAYLHAHGFFSSESLDYELECCVSCGLKKITIDTSKDLILVCKYCNKNNDSCTCERSVFIECAVECSNCNVPITSCLCKETIFKTRKIRYHGHCFSCGLSHVNCSCKPIINGTEETDNLKRIRLV